MASTWSRRQADLGQVAARAMPFWRAGWTMNEIKAELNISLNVLRAALRARGVDTASHMTRDRYDHGSWKLYELGCRCTRDTMSSLAY